MGGFAHATSGTGALNRPDLLGLIKLTDIEIVVYRQGSGLIAVEHKELLVAQTSILHGGA